MYSTANLRKIKEKMDRKTAVSILEPRHDALKKYLGLSDWYFTIKFPYVPKGLTEKMIGMFPSELNKGDDIYIELTDGDNAPLNEYPTLYKLKHNPFYKEEYHVEVDPSKGEQSRRYFVPVSELEELKILEPGTVKKQFVPDYITDEDKEDCHANELTARDWACIHLKTPQSNKKWLNDLIQNT